MFGLARSACLHLLVKSLCGGTEVSSVRRSSRSAWCLSTLTSGSTRSSRGFSRLTSLCGVLNLRSIRQDLHDLIELLCHFFKALNRLGLSTRMCEALGKLAKIRSRVNGEIM